MINVRRRGTLCSSRAIPHSIVIISILVCAFDAVLLARPAWAQLAANGKTLTATTTNAVATFSGADVVGLVNSLTGETYLTNPSAGELAAVNTMTSFGQPLQFSNWTIGSEPVTGHPLATITGQNSGRTLTMTVKVDPASQEVVLRVSATTSAPGAREVSWSLAGLNLDTGRFILPSDTGIVLDRGHPNLGPWVLSYPYNWHAQMAVYEAPVGSFVVYSTDTQMQYKRLRTTTRGSSTIDVALATEAVAPFGSATGVGTIEWRLKAFNSDWRAAAGRYREWLWAARPPLSNAAHPWVANIRTVVTIPSDTTLLAPLAAVAVPSQTLLYLVDWQQYPFGINRPDYTARAGEVNFISAAHALGFRVMLHFDSLGVSTYNPDYAAMAPYQVRTSDSLELMGWEWQLPPSTQTRYAFINPASAAWRSLLVSRASAGLNGLNADAIHLDLSSSIFNDGNGLMGGLNYAQGMAQLHQDFVNAFPAMAIGGEGETDVTYRYHSFAQAWWLPDGPTEGHPLVTFLFSPQVLFYGHLGQPPARNGLFRNWLLQLQRRAILPQIKVWDAADLDPANADNARLLALVQSWQSHSFTPDWNADWMGALVRYAGTGATTAALTDSGTMTTLTAAGAPLFRIAHDVNQIATASTARNWPAFDASSLYGLDPAKRYFLDSVARPSTTHVTSLPSGARLGRGTTVGPGFAHIEVLPAAGTSISLETATVAARLGVTYLGADWPLANGAVVNMQSFPVGGVSRTGLLIHPPWQGQVGGETFAEFTLAIPPAAMLQFSVGVGDSADCTDGATFRVTAGGIEIWRQHILRSGWQGSAVSLASYAGTTIPIRLITNPGPSGSPSCDFALWSSPKLVATPAVGSISVPLALSSGSVVSGFDGNGVYASTGALTGLVSGLPVPGQFTLFTQSGVPVANGTNLATLSFAKWMWAHGEMAEPGAWTNAGSVGPMTIGGVTKSPAIWSPPPEGGATKFSWLLQLPNSGNLRLGWSAGILDNAFTQDGVEFTVWINGVPYWRLTKLSIGWTPGSLDLSPWRGQNILVELSTDVVDTLVFDWSAWADLVLSTSATTCAYSIPPGASVVPAGGTFSFNVTATSTCAWNAVSSAPGWLMPVSGSGSSNGTATYTVAPNPGAPRSATLTLGGQTFTVTQSGTLPTLTLDKTLLRFAAVSNGAALLSKTAAQTVRLAQLGSGTATWTATSNQPWLQVSPASGTGSATLSVDVVSIGGLPIGSTLSGAITLSAPGAANIVAPIDVTLRIIPNGTSANPFGSLDTPLDNGTGITGAVPFTGWALDDLEVSNVMICRAAFGSEVAPVDPNCGGAAEIFLGFGVFIDGARPDVQSFFSTYPRNSRAGWGFMVLTNMLPNQGNGTYFFSVYATDRDGHVMRVGTRTLTCDNAHAIKPFGAIDTPTQGGLASGASFVNFGWALTQAGKSIPADGSTISVLVDGVSVGTASYNHYRIDIASLFPGLANTDGAVGFKVLDTTTLTNGLHTIVWVISDSAGQVEGIGSRFFTVSNGAGAVVGAVESANAMRSRPVSETEVGSAPLAGSPAFGRRGWEADAPWTSLRGDVDSRRIVVRGEELEHVELWLGPHDGDHYTGYLRVGDDLAPLPVGSHLDATSGWFTWAPGAGFIGSYDLVFVRWAGNRAVSRHEVRIVLGAKGARGGPPR